MAPASPPAPNRPARIAWGVVGCALVAYLAAELALLHRFPIFYDEAVFAAEAQAGFDHPTLHNLFLAASDNHGPLQRWLGFPGLAAGISSVTSLRLVSIVSGLVAIAATAFAGRSFGDATAALAAVIAALTPALFVHGTIGTTDPVVAAFTALALAGTLQLADRPTALRGLAVGLAIALGLLAKRTILSAAVVALLSVPARDLGETARERWWQWARAFGIVLVLLAGAALVLSLAPDSLQAIGAGYSSEAYRSIWDVSPGDVWTNLRHFGDVAAGYATLPVLVVAAVGAVAAWRQRPRAALIVLAATLLPFVVAVAITKLSYPRYILAVFSPLAVLAAAGMVAIAERMGTARHGRLLGGLLIAAVLAPALLFDARVLAHPGRAHYPGLDDWQYVSGFAAGTPWPKVARALEASAKKEPRGVITVAYGGRSTGPIGLAAEIGKPELAPGSVNALNFFATADDGRRYHFLPYSLAPDARFVIAQEVQARPIPAEVLERTKPLTSVQRPHNGSEVVLLERR